MFYRLIHLMVQMVKMQLAYMDVVFSVYMGVTGLVCSHFLMLGNPPTMATKAHKAGQLVKSPSSTRALGWLGLATFMELMNW